MTLPHDVAYWDKPEQVIWVDVGPRRLQGMDFMWVGEDRYGMWNDPRNRHIYDGRQAVAWTWDGATEEEAWPCEIRGRVYEGFMLTTEQAEAVGIL
jgi:hypothetical protein